MKVFNRPDITESYNMIYLHYFFNIPIIEKQNKEENLLDISLSKIHPSRWID
jgi:hypothetical protein